VYFTFVVLLSGPTSEALSTIYVAAAPIEPRCEPKPRKYPPLSALFAFVFLLSPVSALGASYAVINTPMSPGRRGAST
jgi:hypothetical protein